jgi:hypothetical protein
VIEIRHRIGKLILPLPYFTAQQISVRMLRIERDGALALRKRVRQLALLRKRAAPASDRQVGLWIELFGLVEVGERLVVSSMRAKPFAAGGIGPRHVRIGAPALADHGRAGGKHLVLLIGDAGLPVVRPRGGKREEQAYCRHRGGADGCDASAPDRRSNGIHSLALCYRK